MGMTIEVRPHAGTDMHEAARHAIAIAQVLGVTVEFSFNGVGCSVLGSDHPRQVAELQQVAQRLGYRWAWQACGIPEVTRLEILAREGNSWKHADPTPTSEVKP